MRLSRKLDVRKPFQTLRFALQTLIASKNEGARKIGIQISEDISTSVRSVNAMLGDIIDIGKTAGPLMESVSPIELVKSAAGMVTKLYPESKVTFDYQINHRHMARADGEQILRVLTNLIENAFHATGLKGSIKIGVDERADKAHCKGNFSGSGNSLYRRAR